MNRALAALAALLVAAAALARAPEIVPWREAGAHVGRVITIEGTVVSARVGGGACTLEFAADDPSAFRVVLVLALFSSPAQPERLYAGRRVRASGRVQTFQGRPEMIIRRADQIELVDDGSTTTTLPPPTKVPAVAPTLPVTPPSTVPHGAQSGAAPRPAPTELCTRARERYDADRRELAARTEDATRCLREGTSRCQAERDAVTRALEALPRREAEADRACE